ncbi:MAG: hypothetical protein H7A35_06380 [Planctomycetales bacterium]|nr:hypothetical protein [bacterium]UNM09686.1 MAG: hypothetical protein H7A35_06380 [Planctomycetales bacterium]
MLAALCACLCAWLLVGPAAAQNTAEKEPPPASSSEKETPPPANNAEKETPPANAAEKETPPANAAEKETPPANAAEKGDGTKPQEEPAQPDGKGNANAAEAGKTDKPAGEDEPKKEESTPPANVAEGDKPEGQKPAQPGEAPPMQTAPEIDPRNPANTAESGGQELPDGVVERGASDTVIAVEGDPGVNAEGIAEPPETEMILPSPAEAAGNVAEGEPEPLNIQVPMLDNVGPPPDVDEFYSPERSYLGRRPLPSLDETETDEERLARNVEQSLDLLDLAGETRPDGGINIPLPSGQLTFKAADAFQYDRRNRILTFTGNAELLFGTIAVWADFIEVNDQAATAYAKGYVAIQQGDDIVYADEAYLNYDTETFELFWVEGNTTGPRVRGNIFFMADRALGTFDQMIMYNADVTTCDPYCGQLKEYRLNARKVNYRKDNSVVLHDVWIYVHNNKIAYVPILAIPIPHEQSEWKPGESEVQQTYGWSRAEGAFAKFAYTYSTRYAEGVNGPLLGVAKVDVMQRRGVGVGLRQDFYNPEVGVTTISSYIKEEWPQMVAVDLFGRKETTADSGNEFSFLLDQELNFSRKFNGSLKIDRQKSFIPSASGTSIGRLTNTWRNNLTMKYQAGDTTANLSFRHNIDIRGGQTNADGTQEPRSEPVTINGTLSLRQNLSDEFTFNGDTQYNSTKSQNQTRIAADQEANYKLDLTFQGRQETALDGYTGKLTYAEQGIDLDGDDNTTDRNVQVNRQIPSIEITAPRDLINDGAYFTTFKLNLDKLVTGRRRDAQAAQRMKVEFGGRDRLEFSNASSLDTSANFKQYWYDDTNSQYVINTSAQYKYDPKSWYVFDAQWRLNYQQGVQEPPVRGDRATKLHTVTYNWTFGNMRSWRWQLRSGYNLEDGRPNPISSTFYFDPNRTFGLTHTLQLRNNIRPNTDAGNDTTHSSWTFNQSHLVGTWRSPYIADDGYYNWLLNFTIDNDPEDEWQLTKLSTSWFKRWGYGWSTELVGDYRKTANGPNPDFAMPFFKDYLKKVTVRKVNCCTTMELGWRTELKEVYLNMYINALQQYPAHADYRTQNSHIVGDTYFPWEQVRQDVLTDVFGINQQIPFF